MKNRWSLWRDTLNKVMTFSFWNMSNFLLICFYCTFFLGVNMGTLKWRWEAKINKMNDSIVHWSSVVQQKAREFDLRVNLKWRENKGTISQMWYMILPQQFYFLIRTNFNYFFAGLQCTQAQQFLSTFSFLETAGEGLNHNKGCLTLDPVPSPSKTHYWLGSIHCQISAWGF